MIEFIKEYATLINTTLLLGFIVLLVRIFNILVKSKESEISSLKEQIRLSKVFSVDDVSSKFSALKTLYQDQLTEWYDYSIKTLEKEKEKAIENKEIEYKSKLEENIISIREDYEKELDNYKNFKLEAKSVVGKYTILGRNPTNLTNTNTYSGTLEIERKNQLFNATWLINNNRQKHEGVGFITGNKMAFQFWYNNRSNIKINGIVVYEFISENVIRGIWTGSLSDDLGFEEGHKIKDKSSDKQ